MTRRKLARTKHLLLIFVVLIASLIFGLRTPAGQPARKLAAENQPGLVSVSRFIDGDTIAVSMQGTVEKVRLIGVDTPETHKPNTPVQCYGPAAAAHTKILIGSHRVRLESDSLSTDRDRYNRLLRYVYLPDGTSVNEDLINNGYAFYYPYFPFTKAEQFSALQASAKANFKGLWGNCNTIKKGQCYVSNTAS